MIGGHCLQVAAPPSTADFRHCRPVVCGLTKQGERLLSSLATREEPAAAVGLLRKFVASSSKHVVLTTLSHILSPSTLHPRLSPLAFPLYSVIKQESWFSWNAKIVADLIALLYREEQFELAEDLFAEAVSKLGFKERDLCMFYSNLVDSHAKHKSERGVLDSSTQLSKLVSQSSSVYVKQRGYESMVAGFCELGLPNKAENLMQEMRENGLKPSSFEFKTLIYGYGQKGLLEDMKRIIFQMENEGFELDTVSCNMVLSSFGAHNELGDMFLWLKKVRDSDIQLSIRTYNSILNYCPSIISLLKDMKSVPLSMEELVGNLKMEEVNLVVELLKSSVLEEMMEWGSLELKLDLHGMHLSSAYLILLQWFDELKERLVDGNETAPTEVLVVCGSGKHSSTRGESPVKDLAKEMMIRMKCPLRIDRKNIGCFVAKGRVLKDWLCLQNAQKRNSIK